MIITDGMIDAFMDAKSDDWRAGTVSSIARIRAIVREDLEHAAAVLAPAIAAAEREECARIADAILADKGYPGRVHLTAEVIADAIRARGAS